MFSMRLRSKVGVIVGRTAARGLAIAKRPGTTLPGYLAERLSATVLGDLMRDQSYTSKIVITGTNGKTTTTRLVSKILEANGEVVVSNLSGSNLYRGVMTTVLKDKHHQQDNKVLVLEVDEASLPRVCQSVRPTHLVVLNLFRDQLDRYGEVSTTQAFIQQAVDASPKTELILCADDPWVAMLGRGRTASVEYFGLDLNDLQALPHDDAGDYPLSPETHQPLIYSQRYFSHLGKYTAQDKSWSRPQPTCVVTGYKAQSNQVNIDITMQKKQHKVVSPLVGIYNSYNIAAAFLLSARLKVADDTVLSAIEQATAAFGRQEVISRNGVDYQLFLIKNPTGFNQVISSAFRAKPKDKEGTLIIINDNFADGRDISWLWDVAIEDMKLGKQIVVSGVRAYDMGLRLRYAGIDCQVVTSIPHAVLQVSKGNKSVKVLPTYTALLEVRKLLGLTLGDIS